MIIATDSSKLSSKPLMVGMDTHKAKAHCALELQNVPPEPQLEDQSQ